MGVLDGARVGILEGVVVTGTLVDSVGERVDGKIVREFVGRIEGNRVGTIEGEVEGVALVGIKLIEGLQEGREVDGAHAGVLVGILEGFRLGGKVGF